MFRAGVTWLNIASQLKAYIVLWELCGFNKFSNFHIHNTKFSSGFSIKFEDYSITRLWQSLGSWSQRVNLFLSEGIAQQSGRNYSIWENEVNKAQDEYQKVSTRVSLKPQKWRNCHMTVFHNTFNPAGRFTSNFKTIRCKSWKCTKSLPFPSL